MKIVQLIKSYRTKARLLAEEYNGFWIDQYNNKDNPDAHYKTTGPEIWKQMKGKIDYFFIGVGTGGTVTGVTKYLKEQDPNIKVIGRNIFIKTNLQGLIHMGLF